MPSPRLAASRSMRRSRSEHGRLVSRAVIAAVQSMAARPVPSPLAELLMKRLVKSARRRNVA